MALLLALLACTNETPKDTDTPVGPTCELTVSTSIADGATNVPGNTRLRVSLSERDPTATVSASVEGTTSASEDGQTLIWTPSRPMDPQTDITVSIATCAGTSSLAFRTADMGGALDEDVNLDATGFRVDLASGTILQPTTGSALLGVLSSQGTEVLLGVLPDEGGGLTYRLAVTTDGVQDPCSRTLDLAGDPLDRGWFGFGPGLADFQVYDTQVVLEDLAFGGALLADGSGIEAAWLSGYVGVAALAVAYADGDVDQACTFFGGLGAPCEPCPSGDGECLAIEVEGLSGVATGEPVASVTEACPEGSPE